MKFEIDWLSTTTIPWYKFTKKKRYNAKALSPEGCAPDRDGNGCSQSRRAGSRGADIIVVAPGGPTVGVAAAPTARPNAVASTQPLSPDQAQSPGSASPQPMDCDDNHPGPDNDPGLHSTPCSGTRGVSELFAQPGVWRDTVPSTARGCLCCLRRSRA
jgi:hypothetical protein